ncbi:MAG: hypothetical protein OXG92_04025 [Chloroflexi bacterium]|nr:hypothetical protein [Chloroflexota bacterium]MCY3581099.1 hypothetical protein [Chloroflexota bacterium]MCY3715624.1 hypothetical protein [Chloroflexota bacterium]MDE2650638.1 hypothetical protein [Chloroflexota bacterium]MXV92662.1 hypothetical protein [Chloroflexota bacterium]
MMNPNQPEARENNLAAADEQPETTAAFAELTKALEAALVPREPREAFARELRAQILNEPNSAPARLRNLSPRLQFAAALALVAGFMLLMLRRLLGGNTGGELVEDSLPSSA